MVDVKPRFLAFLGQTAVFAVSGRALDDLVTQGSRDVIHPWDDSFQIRWVRNLSSEQIRQIRQPFSFFSFCRGEYLPLVLTTEQILETLIHSSGKGEPRGD